MIIIYIGGIGSGKTLSAVREIAISKNKAYTNFKLNNNIGYHRLKLSDIAIYDEKIKNFNINWDFWEKARKENFSIYLDEVHNIISSRRSMSKMNICLSKWVSQIRKILSDSPHNHLYLISQSMRKIDIDFRELAQIIVLCRKYTVKGKTYIVQTYYNGIDNYENNKKSLMVRFCANSFFKYYNTNELVSFGDSEVYV